MVGLGACTTVGLCPAHTEQKSKSKDTSKTSKKSSRGGGGRPKNSGGQADKACPVSGDSNGGSVEELDAKEERTSTEDNSLRLEAHHQAGEVGGAEQSEGLARELSESSSDGDRAVVKGSSPESSDTGTESSPAAHN